MLKAAALAANYAEAAAAARKLSAAASQQPAAPLTAAATPAYGTAPISAAALAAGTGATSVPDDEAAAKRSAAAVVLQMFGMAPTNFPGVAAVIAGRHPKPTGNRPTAEVTINDAPPRVRVALTKRSGQQELEAKWRVVVSLKGRYTPPGAPVPGEGASEGERPLFLRITPAASLQVRKGRGQGRGQVGSPLLPTYSLPADLLPLTASRHREPRRGSKQWLTLRPTCAP